MEMEMETQENPGGMCIYCYCDVTDRTLVPAAEDDEMWETLAPEHHDECEWILTRAHRVSK